MFRNVAVALGGMTRLAKNSGLNRQNLYKAFSGKRDPAYSTVEGIVHGLGYTIKVEPMRKPAIHGPAPKILKKAAMDHEKPKHFYQWAEDISKKKGFSELKEKDVVRLVKKARKSTG
jgi:DNA-binding phage protein